MNVILMYQVIFKSHRIVKYLNYFVLQIYYCDNLTLMYAVTLMYAFEKHIYVF